MQNLYNYDAPKKSANLSINSDLLQKAKAQNINLSAALEQTLKAKLAETQANKWQRENKNAIHEYNRFIEEKGLFSDEHRGF